MAIVILIIQSFSGASSFSEKGVTRVACEFSK